MGPFHVNNTFGRHLGRHLVAYKLGSYDLIIQFIDQERAFLELIRVLNVSISCK